MEPEVWSYRRPNNPGCYWATDNIQVQGQQNKHQDDRYKGVNIIQINAPKHCWTVMEVSSYHWVSLQFPCWTKVLITSIKKLVYTTVKPDNNTLSLMLLPKKILSYIYILTHFSSFHFYFVVCGLTDTFYCPLRKSPLFRHGTLPLVYLHISHIMCSSTSSSTIISPSSICLIISVKKFRMVPYPWNKTQSNKKNKPTREMSTENICTFLNKLWNRSTMELNTQWSDSRGEEPSPYLNMSTQQADQPRCVGIRYKH